MIFSKQRHNIASAALFCALAFGAMLPVSSAEDWKRELQSELPTLGHRNWIVVADSAYPSQTAAGIKTVYVGGDQLDAVAHVLSAVKGAAHVSGHVFVDTELEFVDEEAARGIGRYRSGLNELLQDQNVSRLPHEDIITQMQAAGDSFHILVLKTDLTLPYTSVFIRLDAGYWSDEAEAALRAAMSSSQLDE